MTGNQALIDDTPRLFEADGYVWIVEVSPDTGPGLGVSHSYRPAEEQPLARVSFRRSDGKFVMSTTKPLDGRYQHDLTEDELRMYFARAKAAASGV